MNWFWALLISQLYNPSLVEAINVEPEAVLPVVIGSDAFSLNGEWSFHYVKGLDSELADSFSKPEFDVSKWDKIAVPGNWEVLGFAEPH